MRYRHQPCFFALLALFLAPSAALAADVASLVLDAGQVTRALDVRVFSVFESL